MTVESIAETFDDQSTINPDTGCWEWQRAKTVEGYGQLSYFGRHTVAHRIAWERAFGDITSGKWVLHKCDNPACVNPAHLFLGDAKANTGDMIAKRRHVHGADHWFAKLDDAKVEQIKRRVAAGEMQSTLADEYGIARSIVCEIIAGRAWRHVA